jgi:hypothetical protein
LPNLSSSLLTRKKVFKTLTPDALMKEQLVEMTGLSPRVVRVWFQNKRCKDKKKMQMKQSKVRKIMTDICAMDPMS